MFEISWNRSASWGVCIPSLLSRNFAQYTVGLYSFKFNLELALFKLVRVGYNDLIHS